MRWFSGQHQSLVCVSALAAAFWVFIADRAAAQTNCVAAPSDLVAWWPAQDNCGDAAATNGGIFEGTAAFEPGRVGDAFRLALPGNSLCRT